MGRRRYQKHQEAESNFEVALTAAFRSTIAGLFLTILCAVFGASLRANPKSLAGIGPGIGGILLLIAALFAAITAAGFLSRHRREVGEVLAGLIGAVVSGIGTLTRRRRPAATATRLAKPQPAATAPTAATPAPPRTAAATRTAPRMQAVPAPSILSKGEAAFYLPLRDIVAGRLEVHPKPSLADVLQCRDHPRAKDIAAMHVDFLLCDPQTLTPRLVIELDDRSHADRRRLAVDQWKAELLAGRQIPLLRWRCRQAYDVQALREAIESALNTF